MQFHSALATFEPQNHVVVKQIGAKIKSLVSGRLLQ